MVACVMTASGNWTSLLRVKKNSHFPDREENLSKAFTIIRRTYTAYSLNFIMCHADIVAAVAAGTVLMDLRNGMRNKVGYILII